MRTLHDIYRCTQCGFIAAHGNSFCRDCGIEFSDEDISVMKANTHAVPLGWPWNMRDVYRCVHCAEHIALVDRFCRGCGDEICDQEKQLMKMRMDEIAKQNTPAFIGCMLFVLLVIYVLTLL